MLFRSARIKMISDGDVLAAIATCFDTGVDILMGIGGAPEGVLAAAALKCMDGDFQGVLAPKGEAQEERCRNMNVEVGKVFKIDDLVRGDEVVFAATGVSHGELLDGVKYYKSNKASTHSIVMRSETGTIRFVEAVHQLNKKPEYAK